MYIRTQCALAVGVLEKCSKYVFHKEVSKMKDGIHGNREQVKVLPAGKILSELYDKAKIENDGKVHIREIKNGHVGEMIEKH